MANSAVMSVVNSHEYLLEQNGCFFFREELLGNNSVEELAAVSLLHDKVNEFFVLKILVHFNDIRVVERLQNLNFSSELGHVLDLFLLDDLDGSLLLREFVRASLDDAVRAAAELVSDVVLFFEVVHVLDDHRCLLDQDSFVCVSARQFGGLLALAAAFVLNRGVSRTDSGQPAVPLANEAYFMVLRAGVFLKFHLFYLL